MRASWLFGRSRLELRRGDPEAGRGRQAAARPSSPTRSGGRPRRPTCPRRSWRCSTRARPGSTTSPTAGRSRGTSSRARSSGAAGRGDVPVDAITSASLARPAQRPAVLRARHGQVRAADRAPDPFLPRAARRVPGATRAARGVTAVGFPRDVDSPERNSRRGEKPCDSTMISRDRSSAGRPPLRASPGGQPSASTTSRGCAASSDPRSRPTAPGGVHGADDRHQGRQARDPHLDDELGRQGDRPPDDGQGVRDEAALEPRRPVPGVSLGPRRRRNDVSQLWLLPRAGGEAEKITELQGRRRGLRLVARTASGSCSSSATRIRMRPPRKRQGQEAEDEEADRHRPLPVQARRVRLSRTRGATTSTSSTARAARSSR